MNEQNFENSQEELKLNIEEKEDGDIFFINGLGENDLLDLAMLICKKIDRSCPIGEESKKSLSSGEAMRPGGCFSVFYDKGKSQLFIDNRNARGDEEYREKLRNAVNFATQEYLNKDKGSLEKVKQEPVLQINERQNGNVFFISGLDKDKLLDISFSICEKLGVSNLSYTLTKDHLIGGAVKVGECFSIKYNRDNRWIYIDNKERSDVKMKEKLRNAINSAIQEYNK